MSHVSGSGSPLSAALCLSYAAIFSSASFFGTATMLRIKSLKRENSALLGGGFFPIPMSLRHAERGALDQPRVRQATAHGRFQDAQESVSILACPLVEAERLVGLDLSFHLDERAALRGTTVRRLTGIVLLAVGLQIPAVQKLPASGPALLAALVFA
jgi:hypothetical protein